MSVKLTMFLLIVMAIIFGITSYIDIYRGNLVLGIIFGSISFVIVCLQLLLSYITNKVSKA